MASCACCGWKAVMWWTLGLHTLISTAYLGLCATTGSNLQRATYIGTNDQIYKRGLMACVVLSFIVVHLFLILSPMVLSGKVFPGNKALSFGVLIGSGMNCAWVVLLSGLVLNAAENLENYWSTTDYSVLQATYAFAYIQCGSFLFLTLMLFLGRGALTLWARTAGDNAHQVGPAAVCTTTATNVELPANKSAQWPPSSAGTTSVNASSGPGARVGWNGGTMV